MWFQGLRHRYKKVEELNQGSKEATDFFPRDCLVPRCQQHSNLTDVGFQLRVRHGRLCEHGVPYVVTVFRGVSVCLSLCVCELLFVRVVYHSLGVQADGACRFFLVFKEKNNPTKIPKQK